MYIMEEHTALHARQDLWRGKYSMPLNQEIAGRKKDLGERIDDHVKNLLNTHKSEPLSESLLKKIDNIVEKYKK